jgi:hypothetical protein
VVPPDPVPELVAPFFGDELILCEPPDEEIPPPADVDPASHPAQKVGL